MLNIPSELIQIPYEYLDYVVYNYNHNGIPEETLDRALSYYHLTREDIADKIKTMHAEKDDLGDLIGGLPE